MKAAHERIGLSRTLARIAAVFGIACAMALAPQPASPAAKEPADSGPPQEECMRSCRLAYDFCLFFAWGSETLFLSCFNNYSACIRSCGWVPPETMGTFRCAPAGGSLAFAKPEDPVDSWLHAT
jgi:hypothetical protein